jgi:hypothetical protein
VQSEPVGIDDLNVNGSTLSISFDEIAAARGVSNKVLQCVKFARRRSCLHSRIP